jgi:hypothetical protein
MFISQLLLVGDHLPILIVNDQPVVDVVVHHQPAIIVDDLLSPCVYVLKNENNDCKHRPVNLDSFLKTTIDTHSINPLFSIDLRFIIIIIFIYQQCLKTRRPQGQRRDCVACVDNTKQLQRFVIRTLSIQHCTMIDFFSIILLILGSC